MGGKQTLFGFVGVAVAAFVGAIFSDSGNSSGAAGLSEESAFTIRLTPTDHTLGSRTAPVQLVEYAAPTCPVCARWNMAVFPSFKATYIDSGKVFYVFRVFPLQPADLAVEALAHCLPESGYFPFIDMMYRNQSRWDPDGYQIPDVHVALVTMGRIAGMSATQANSCISDQTALRNASAVGDYAGNAYKIDSTPSFIIDGKFHQLDVMTVQGIGEIIEAELKKKNS